MTTTQQPEIDPRLLFDAQHDPVLEYMLKHNIPLRTRWT
jgi:hypothetical protein